MEIIPFPVERRGVGARQTAARLVDLVEAYERTQHALGRRPDGVEQYVRSLRRFLAWLGDDATPEDLSRPAVLEYRDAFGARRSAGSTVINALAVISSFCEWLVERGHLAANPAAEIARPCKAPANPQPLTPEQIRTLLDAIIEPPDLGLDAAWTWRRNRRIVYLGLFGGLRREEIRLLCWAHVQLADELLAVQDGAKGGRSRRVAIHPDLMPELLAVPDYARQPAHAVAGLATGGPLSRGGIEHVFDRWLGIDLDIDARLGTHLHPHKLRTTFSTFFIWSGGSLITLQKLLGHRDLNTTQHYVLSDDEQKRREVGRLRFDRRED